MLRLGRIFFAVVPVEHLTEFEHAHSYAFDIPQRLLELTRMFQKIYFNNAKSEMTYTGLKAGSLGELVVARLRGTRLAVSRRIRF